MTSKHTQVLQEIMLRRLKIAGHALLQATDGPSSERPNGARGLFGMETSSSARW